VRNASLLVAIGVNQEGFREVQVVAGRLETRQGQLNGVFCGI